MQKTSITYQLTLKDYLKLNYELTYCKKITMVILLLGLLILSFSIYSLVTSVEYTRIVFLMILAGILLLYHPLKT